MTLRIPDSPLLWLPDETLLFSGFVEEGRKKEAVWRDNQWEDVVLMGMLKKDLNLTNGEQQ